MEIALHFPGGRALENGFFPQKDSMKSIIRPCKSIKFFFERLNRPRFFLYIQDTTLIAPWIICLENFLT